MHPHVVEREVVTLDLSPAWLLSFVIDVDGSRVGDAGTLTRACVALCFASSLGGCSFLFVERAPAKVAPDTRPDCTTSVAAPVVDTVVATLQGVRTVIALAASDADYSDAPISREADIAFGVGFSVLFAASAAYGFGATSTCDRVQRDASASAEPAGPREPSSATRLAPSARPPPEAQCTYDAQCGGVRVCEHGMCVPLPKAATGAAP